MAPTEVELALQEFGASLTRNLSHAGVNPAQPEDQLKAPMTALLERAGRALGFDVVTRTEAQSRGGVRPDIGVAVAGVLTGHLELKAPGKGVRPKDFSAGHDREQFRRLSDHPNFVYTDGNQWALYRDGALVGSTVTADGDVRSDGAAAYGPADAVALEILLRDFLGWRPLVPPSPRALAELLAPLTRLLREQVRATAAVPGSALAELASEWRDFFFPDADDAQFADAYAQTLTYALLLARVEGEVDLHARAADRLDRRHGLLAQVLRVLGDPAARAEVAVPIDLLERTIAAVLPDELSRRARDKDLWLYFYEDFLAAYDPALRKQRGVYFTPTPVVQAQVGLVRELLRERFGKELGFADDDVSVLDPAVGTGTYLLAALASGLADVEAAYGAGAVAGRATSMAQRFHGFELGIGPYAVAQLRLSQRILEAEGELPTGGVHVYLTDTLSSPYQAPQGLAHAPLFLRKLADENERARHVKADVPILVCIGNPPYFRQVIDPDESDVERQGGWIRFGDDGEDSEAKLRDFFAADAGVHRKNLYNLYVYFWRWALWKVYESLPGEGRGVVSFITASSYLRGPGFVGMRRFMRETFDELWILDLGGEGRGARKSENVFSIQTPVAIAVGLRRDEAGSATPASVRYARIDGTRESKLSRLEEIRSVGDLSWQDCPDGWEAPFLPVGSGDFHSWPLLTDLFPWQHSGAQFKRTWPIAPDRRTLARRWGALLSGPPEERRELFRETRDRKIDRAYPPLLDGGEPAPALADEPDGADAPPATAYSYRSHDRQFCLLDNRLGDFLRPALWSTVSSRQLFMTSLLSGVLGDGPAAVATHLVPDLHHFRGSFGAKDVIPLWRDAAATDPNVTAGLLDRLGETLGRVVAPEDLFAYAYALLSAPGYVERFAEELEVPGPRLPLTSDRDRFERAVRLGRRLVWLHTYGERFVPAGERAGALPSGRARATVPVPGGEDGYPTGHSYDAGTQTLRVGEGSFAPVAPEVRAYSVSGLDVIGSWLDYRMRDGAGRRSSRLDLVRPVVWPAEFTEELLRLLWIVEATVELRPALDGLLGDVIAGPTIAAADLPVSTDAERKPPA
jgi:hypothetical protein